MFWVSSFLVIYPFVLYPLVLLFLNNILARLNQVPQASHGDVAASSVSLIISAFNEEFVIGQKLDNALSLDYPRDLLEILVVSDGSTDGTDTIVKRYAAADGCIKLVRMNKQSGKTLGLNEAITYAKGEIVVFSDANAFYDKDAIKHLVSPFSCSEIGYTVGSAHYHDNEAGDVNVSEGLYWKYELWIKKLESQFFSVVGGDGAIYAIRRKLYFPLSPIDISDFVNPLQIIAAGYKGVFLSDAKSYEGGTDEFADEFKRKRRIVNRAWGAVRRHIGLFSVSANFRFLFMLVSHKVIRWWSSAFVLVALFSAGILAVDGSGVLYTLLFFGICSTVITSIIGWRMDKAGLQMPKIVYLIYYFYLVGVASLLGILDDFRGKTQSTWTHGRRTGT